MLIWVISDIHENTHNLSLFFQEIEKYKLDKIVFLWDFINNGIAKMLAASKIPVTSIRWNNDGDKVAITKTAMSKWSNLTVGATTFDIIEIDNRRIFITHYPILAKPMAKSGDFDAVFYWHNHKYNRETIWKCSIVNPWEISAHKTKTATFAIYNTDTNKAEIYHLENSISVKSDVSDNYRKNMGFEFSQTKTHQY